MSSFARIAYDAKWAETMPQESPIMIFIKYFDTINQALSGIGHFYVHRHMRVSELIPMINERMTNDRMDWSVTTALKIYEVGHQGVFIMGKLS